MSSPIMAPGHTGGIGLIGVDVDGGVAGVGLRHGHILIDGLPAGPTDADRHDIPRLNACVRSVLRRHMDMTVRRDHALLDLDAAAGPHDPAAGRPFVILGAGFTDHSGNAQLAGVRGGNLHLNILAQRPQNGDLGDAALGALDLLPAGYRRTLP